MLIRLKIADIRFEMGQQAHFFQGKSVFFSWLEIILIESHKLRLNYSVRSFNVEICVCVFCDRFQSIYHNC